MSASTAADPRYLPGVATLRIDPDACTGCRQCTFVCPHGVFDMADDGLAHIVDLDACMECGACVTNCAFGALTVNAGVGCASAIVRSWVLGGEPSCGCDDDAPPTRRDAAPTAGGVQERR